jgi:phosphate uptake regulator
MKRRLTKLGNESYSITLPKTWVMKNNLKPRSDLEISESSGNLIISANLSFEELPKKVIHSGSRQPDEIISEFTAIYRFGYSEIKIAFTNNDKKDDIDRIVKHIANYHGIVSELFNDHILIKTAEGKGKRSEILQKCFQNVVMLSELLLENPLEDGWKQQVKESYERIYFLSEYVFRLISIQSEADLRLALNHQTMAWSLQCIGELLKKISELEYENAKLKKNSAAGKEIQSIIRSVYNFCILKKAAIEYYNAKTVLQKNMESKQYCKITTEYISMCQFLCTKLVKQEIVDK